MKKTLLLLSFVFSFLFIEAQQLLLPHKAGIGIGTATYNGDLCNSFDCYSYKLNISANMRYLLTDQISIRSKVNYFRLKSDDMNAVRNLSFRSDNINLGVDFVYDFTKYHPHFNKRSPVMPYVFLGLRALFTNPKAEYNGEWYDLQPLQTEGKSYSNTVLNIPLGLGFRWEVSPNFNIGFEVAYHYAFSDYLDDVSGNYRDSQELQGISRALADRTYEGGNIPTQTDDGVHWREGVKRGSSNNNDGFILTEITLEFDLVKPGVQCPIY